MYDPILESGLQFNNKDVWRIEKSSLYSSLSKGNDGLNVVELIRVKGGNYIFEEAKSSFPELHNPDSTENVEKNISTILNKFMHSLSILSSVHLHVNDVPVTEMPDAFHHLSKPSIHFVLVLHFPDGTESICEEIKTVFMARLSKELMRIWRAKVWVMNEHQAQKMGLVLAPKAPLWRHA